MTVVDLGALDEFADGEARRVQLDGLPAIAVVRIDDDVYALGDRCTHQDISLSEGDVDRDERSLECWKHGSAFDLATGAPTSLPAVKPVPVYDVAVVDGRVLLTVDVDSSQATSDHREHRDHLAAVPPPGSGTPMGSGAATPEER